MTALAGEGIVLETGPFKTRVRSRIPAVARAIGHLYSAYPRSTNEPFADFHVELRPSGTIRRWVRPQVLFFVDGRRPFTPLPLVQAPAMLEWGLNWCIYNHAHSYLIIHAAVVADGSNALILPAPPGSGKSTLCAALVSRGWRLLSDELALIVPGSAEVWPVPRPISLKNRSIEVISEFAPDASFGEIMNDTAKGRVAHIRAPGDSVRRMRESAIVRWIIFPQYTPQPGNQLTAVPRAEALMGLSDSAVNFSLLGELGFATAADLVETSGCYSLQFDDLDAAVCAIDGIKREGHSHGGRAQSPNRLEAQEVP